MKKNHPITKTLAKVKMPAGKRFFAIVTVILSMQMMFIHVCGWAKPSDFKDSAYQFMISKGLEAFDQGRFEQAISSWESVSQKGLSDKSIMDLKIKLSQAYQAIGHYSRANRELTEAYVIAGKNNDSFFKAAILGYLGNIEMVIGSIDKADEYFTESLAIAGKLNNDKLLAVIYNNQANLLTYKGQDEAALQLYRKCHDLAQENQELNLAAISLINAASSQNRSKDRLGAWQSAQSALQLVKKLSPCHDQTFGLIKLGLIYTDIYDSKIDLPENPLALAFTSLDLAAQIAKKIYDYRALSYAWGYLGHLYEKQNQFDDALRLTRRANYVAQKINSPESIYKWQWQSGRILNAMGQIEPAIDAYRRTVDTLQSIRQEMNVVYGASRTSFREAVGPVYFELVDLLLKRADQIQDKKVSERYLIEAREKVELLKVAELRDYFEDDCVVAAESRKTSLDEVSKTAVVIYPIVLPDRLELLVSLPGGLKQFSVPVTREKLTQEILQFRRSLENRISRRYLVYAKTLYDWIIAPIENDLKQTDTKTLVFVPDGPLRTIPMAALYDGTQFLIAKYALAVTPGLNLTDPSPIHEKHIRILELGLTVASQGFPPLPYVADELKKIQAMFQGKILLNSNYLLNAVEENLSEENYNIVHIASHGQFDQDIHKTFLLTYDDKLTLERLDQCIGFFRFREEPLELLTLSACETAAGDDRAALGLAGVAVKAGARSALATLWYINDQASSELVTEFYHQLKMEKKSRAAALQYAQMKLIKDRRYNHPCYWAPFLLINNWL